MSKFSIERKEELEQTLYKIGDRDFLVNDIVRGKHKVLVSVYKGRIKALLTKLSDGTPEELVDTIYDEAGSFIVVALNVAMGLQGDQEVSLEYIDKNMTNSNMVDFAKQFSDDNKLTPVVKLFQELLRPFWRDMVSVIYVNMRSKVTGSLEEAI